LGSLFAVYEQSGREDFDVSFFVERRNRVGTLGVHLGVTGGVGGGSVLVDKFLSDEFKVFTFGSVSSGFFGFGVFDVHFGAGPLGFNVFGCGGSFYFLGNNGQNDDC